MRDVLERLDTWRSERQELAVATVISTWGSAPRPMGSKMVITRQGGIAGSVSAGCVEGAVIEEAAQVMDSGLPRLLTYGVADEQAIQVGLACGGTIRVFVEPGWTLDPVYERLAQRVRQRQPAALLSVLSGPPELANHKLLLLPDGEQAGDLALGAQARAAIRGALELLANETSAELELENGLALFVEVFPAPPRLVIIGAVHAAEPLVEIAKLTGFDTIIIDPRKAFNTPERFPDATMLLRKWPQDALAEVALDRSAYVVALTHDPKIDDPALEVALRSPARYVGALGSQRTNRLRLERLRQAGLTEEQLARLHAPIGLNLGGRSTAEIAVSIIAEIIQVRSQGDNLS